MPNKTDEKLSENSFYAYYVKIIYYFCKENRTKCHDKERNSQSSRTKSQNFGKRRTPCARQDKHPAYIGRTIHLAQLRHWPQHRGDGPCGIRHTARRLPPQRHVRAYAQAYGQHPAGLRRLQNHRHRRLARKIRPHEARLPRRLPRESALPLAGAHPADRKPGGEHLCGDARTPLRLLVGEQAQDKTT